MDWHIDDYKAEFLRIYNENIHRPGADKLLDWLTNKSDFFYAPASTKFHSNRMGGLCEHSVKAYYRFIQNLQNEYEESEEGWEGVLSPESAAIIALLHDLSVADQESVQSGFTRDNLKVIAEVISCCAVRKFYIGHVLPAVELSDRTIK